MQQVVFELRAQLDALRNRITQQEQQRGLSNSQPTEPSQRLNGLLAINCVMPRLTRMRGSFQA